MEDNTENIIKLLRSTADALESGKAEWADYDMDHSIKHYQPLTTDIEVRILGMDLEDFTE